MPVNNEIYNQMADTWWDENSVLHLLRTTLNPARFGYFRDILINRLARDPRGLQVLDIGCGGGLLAEDFAQLGCQVTGIDPSAPSIETARAHAQQMGLSIEYRVGVGESLPFSDETFDLVYCCDVLEHVNDVERVVAESTRVLKPSGIYFYDTINRTARSRLLIIGLFQEWPWTKFAPPNFHSWEKFIKPEELRMIMAKVGLEGQEIVGLSPEGSPPAMIGALLKVNRGQMTIKEFGQKLRFKISKDPAESYAGYALKRAKPVQ
jgi:2-polyprenyl-6-hydroxyphenyl methylase / 3-demethylubiquinone-9 3-methyltransferase